MMYRTNKNNTHHDDDDDDDDSSMNVVHHHQQQHDQHHQLYHQQGVVIAGNNHGASLISSGRYEEAIHQLKLTLKDAKELVLLAATSRRCLNIGTPSGDGTPAVVSHHQQQSPAPRDHHEASSSAGAHSMPRPGVSSFHTSSAADTLVDPRSPLFMAGADHGGPGGEFILWRRPLAVPEPQGGSGLVVDASFSSTIGTANVIFNLALAHHLLGVSSCCSSSSSTENNTSGAAAAAAAADGQQERHITQQRMLILKRAVALYNSSLKLLLSEEGENGGAFLPFSSSPSLMIYRMAVANNMSHCFQLLGAAEENQRSLQCLLNMIMSVLHHHHHHHDGEEQHHHHYYLSASCWSREDVKTLAESLLPNVVHLMMFFGGNAASGKGGTSTSGVCGSGAPAA